MDSDYDLDMSATKPIALDQEETRVIAKEFDTSVLLLANMGEIGQIGIVWFSMGVAIWQLFVIARNIMAGGEKNKLFRLIRGT